MLKNESARNPTRPTPLRPVRLPDSGGIIFMSNRVLMKKISHFVHRAKQAKFWDVDCTCPYSPYRTRVSPYMDTWHVRTCDTWHVCTCDTWHICTGDTWQHQGTTRGRSVR
jgi:hypothetical protein